MAANEKKVTEELVRQNGNQAGAVMADYAKTAKDAIYLKEGTTVYEVKVVGGVLTTTAVV